MGRDVAGRRKVASCLGSEGGGPAWVEMCGLGVCENTVASWIASAEVVRDGNVLDKAGVVRVGRAVRGEKVVCDTLRAGGLKPIGRDFYARPAEVVARDLLGRVLVRVLDNGVVLAGRIVETEAYLGERDPACHSARGRTETTRLFWGPPGHAYVYLCYGFWHCLNVVVEPEGKAGCVLFRALEPLEGMEYMRRFRGGAKKDTELCSGPGRLCQALDIDVRLNGADMTGGRLFVAATQGRSPIVRVTPRIGIKVATDWPLRFFIADNPYVSRAKPAGRVSSRRCERR